MFQWKAFTILSCTQWIFIANKNWQYFVPNCIEKFYVSLININLYHKRILYFFSSNINFSVHPCHLWVIPLWTKNIILRMKGKSNFFYLHNTGQSLIYCCQVSHKTLAASVQVHRTMQSPLYLHKKSTKRKEVSFQTVPYPSRDQCVSYDGKWMDSIYNEWMNSLLNKFRKLKLIKYFKPILFTYIMYMKSKLHYDWYDCHSIWTSIIILNRYIVLHLISLEKNL